MKQSFPDKLWLDVISKSDLLAAHLSAADALMKQHAQKLPASVDKSATSGDTDNAAVVATSSSMHASSVNAQLQHQHFESLSAQRSASSENDGETGNADSNNSSSGSASSYEGSTLQAAERVIDSDTSAVLAEEQDVWGGVLNSKDAMAVAVQAACLFPDALRISSVTQDGIHNLQLAVMHLLSDETTGTAQQPVV